MELKRVVVTGLGAITPLGHNTKESWGNLVKGVSGSDLITNFDASCLKLNLPVRLKTTMRKIISTEKKPGSWIDMHNLL